MPDAIFLLFGKALIIWQAIMHNHQADFALRPGVSFCIADGHAIFLDQVADRYLTLADSQHHAFQKAVAGSLVDADARHQLDRLVDQGLLIHTAQRTAIQPCDGRLPAQAITASQAISVPTLTQLRFAWRVMIARHHIKRKGLQRALRALQRSRHSRSRTITAPMPALREAAELMAAIGRYMTRLDQCLPISLGLAHHLLRQNVDCQLVLGVQLGPFGAHCWVQHDDLLVGDDLDVIRTFTPILVV